MEILFYLLCVFINFAVTVNVKGFVNGSALVKLICVLFGPIYTGIIIGHVMSLYINSKQESPSVS